MYRRPEPAWWADARALRAAGLRTGLIAARLGMHPDTVRMALNPERHERYKARQKARRAAEKVPKLRLHWAIFEALAGLGCSKTFIAKTLGFHILSVRAAIRPETRQNRCATKRRGYRKRHPDENRSAA